MARRTAYDMIDFVLKILAEARSALPERRLDWGNMKLKRYLSEHREFFMDIGRIGLPVALQNLLTSTLSLVDSLMVGGLGSYALGAVGLAGQFSSLLYASYWGLASGGTMFFAQYWGSKDDEGLCRSYGLTMASMMLVGFVFMILAVIFPQAVMGVYTNDPEVQQIGAQYLRIIGLSYPLQVLAMAISCLLRSTENVKVPLYASIGSVLTNTGLNYLLIGGHFGAPALGVSGAAIASLTAAGVNLIILLWFALRDRKGYIRRLRDQFRWTRALIKEYYVKCAPIIANELLYGIGVLLINRVLGRQGADALAAVAIFRSIEGLIFAFFGGLANASSVMIGKQAGAGHLKEAYGDAKRLSLLCPMITLVVCVLVVCLREPILGLFSPTPATAEYVRAMLLIYMVAAPLRTCNYIQVNNFRAGGETLLGAIFEIGGILLISAPIVNLTGLYLHWPFLLVFGSMYLEEVIKVFLETFFTLRGKWLKPVTPEGQAALDEFRGYLKKRHKREACA